MREDPVGSGEEPVRRRELNMWECVTGATFAGTKRGPEEAWEGFFAHGRCERRSCSSAGW